MAQPERAQVVSVSMPPALMRAIQEVAGERLKRGERGGFSGAIRELLAIELDRRRRAARRG